MESLTSPEQLTDYLHVTTPTVWIVMAAIILLLFGIVTLFRGEVRIPLFTKIGDFFKEEEKKD